MWEGGWAIAGNIGGHVTDNFSVTGGLAVSQSGLVGGRVGGVWAW
jgi:hypothetical protein